MVWRFIRHTVTINSRSRIHSEKLLWTRDIGTQWLIIHTIIQNFAPLASVCERLVSAQTTITKLSVKGSLGLWVTHSDVVGRISWVGMGVHIFRVDVPRLGMNTVLVPHILIDHLPILRVLKLNLSVLLLSSFLVPIKILKAHLIFSEFVKCRQLIVQFGLFMIQLYNTIFNLLISNMILHFPLSILGNLLTQTLQIALWIFSKTKRMEVVIASNYWVELLLVVFLGTCLCGFVMLGQSGVVWVGVEVWLLVMAVSYFLGGGRFLDLFFHILLLQNLFYPNWRLWNFPAALLALVFESIFLWVNCQEVSEAFVGDTLV